MPREEADRAEALMPVDVSDDRLYRLLAENATDAMIWVRGDVIAWASPSLETTIGWHPEDWMGHHLVEFTHPRDVPASRRSWRATTDGDPLLHRYRLRSPDGSFHWVEGHAGPLIDDEGKQDGFIELFRLIDDVVAAEEELEKRARLDHLTGLLNRSEMLNRLAATTAHPRREGHQMALLFCDVDQFKPVNDGLGHTVGDEVLRQIAARIASSIRTGDIAARVGGDEFVILLDRVGDAADAVAVAEKIRAAVAEPMTILEHRIIATVSIGVSMIEPNEDTTTLLAAADAAMYAAKRSSRNRVAYIGPDAEHQAVS